MGEEKNWMNYLFEIGGAGAAAFRCPKNSFFSLWQKINGLESLQSNPWVWVIEFERIEKPQEK